jgi:uncharacterized protein YbaA (DUF1428 family)
VARNSWRAHRLGYTKKSVFVPGKGQCRVLQSVWENFYHLCEKLNGSEGRIMNYVDGFVIAVPTANKEAYTKMAAEIGQMFKQHGALKLVECWGDDVPEGKLTSFPMAVKCQPDETVVFAWLEWPSRAARDVGMEQVMADPRMQGEGMKDLFDGKRMIFGGFQVIVDE